MITDFGHVLGNPAWQGVGALIGLGSVAAYLWFEVRRRGGYRWRRSTGPLELFDMSTDDGEQRFYQRLVECVRDAQEAIYRSGHGFSRPGREALYRALLGSEEDALRRGVEMTRIQTGPRVLAGWANGYAELLDDFPDRLRVVGDFVDPPMIDMGIVDPFGTHPVILLLFEAPEASLLGSRSRLASAIIMHGQRSLAGSLGYQFMARARALPAMTSADVRELARTHVYFAYGVHMAYRHLRRDVPDARRLGRAHLGGWRRDYEATVASPAGSRTTVERTGADDDRVEGVAYELSSVGKARLDATEGRAYRPIGVRVEIDGKPVDAYTYVPLQRSEGPDELPAGSSLDLLIEGATENNLTDLLASLRRTRSRGIR